MYFKNISICFQYSDHGGSKAAGNAEVAHVTGGKEVDTNALPAEAPAAADAVDVVLAVGGDHHHTTAFPRRPSTVVLKNSKSLNDAFLPQTSSILYPMFFSFALIIYCSTVLLLSMCSIVP